MNAQLTQLAAALNRPAAPQSAVAPGVVTYQYANSRVLETLKTSMSPIDLIGSWVEAFGNNEDEISTIDLTRFKSFMYRMVVEDTVSSQFGGNFNAIQLDNSIPKYVPRFITKRVEVVKEKNPNYSDKVVEKDSKEDAIKTLEEQVAQLTMLMQHQINTSKSAPPVAAPPVGATPQPKTENRT